MTDVTRLRQVDELVQSALEREAGDRTAFLDQSCADDPPLRAEVESLLSYGDRSKAFIEAPALAMVADLLADDREGESGSLDGRRIGPYEVVREIGRGGMGTVYLARRADEEYRQFVALKIVRRGMDTADILRRFRTERQILASLEHPNIARLLDGGTTEDGVPYLVMEYVEGTPVTVYCDARCLTTTRRLELFRTICAAVQHAHQNLVVHRDLKPSNILITADGTPKLLDFGIAKVLDPDLSDVASDGTRSELRALTPDFASPEQVRGDRLTTATDIYSLGVVLYELLTGHRPYGVAAGPRARIIPDQPPRPSTAVSRVVTVATTPGRPERTITPASVSAARDAQPDKLRRRLEGDLDTIVLMALRSEPSRRYESAAQFGADIGRHLGGLPVIARKDTFTYRTSKFVRRNRLSMAAACLLVLTLTGGIVATVWQANRATQQARIAAAERDKARLESAKAARINAFLQDTLGFSNRSWLSANPLRNREATITEVLEEASRRAETELADQPEVQAAVRFSLGQSYVGQSKEQLAEPHLRAALDIRRRVLGQEHQDTAISLTGLSEVLTGSGKYQEAEALSREAVAIFRRARASGDVNVKWFAMALNDVGISLISKGDAAGGDRFIREALEVSANLAGAERSARAVMHSNLSVALGNQGDIDGAIGALENAVEEHRRAPGKQLALGTTLGNLASFLMIKGEYARAEPLLREALEVYREVQEGKHQYSTWSLIYLADNYYLQGDYRRAREAIDRAIEIQQQVLTEGHVDYARSWTVLGKILTRTGAAGRGESYLRRALERRTAAAPRHWRVAETKGALGECLIAQKRYAGAEPFLLESYNALNASLGQRDPRTQDARQRLVALYTVWRKPEKVAHLTPSYD